MKREDWTTREVAQGVARELWRICMDTALTERQIDVIAAALASARREALEEARRRILDLADADMWGTEGRAAFSSALAAVRSLGEPGAADPNLSPGVQSFSSGPEKGEP